MEIARTGHSKRPRIKFLETDEGGKKVGSGAFAPCRRRNLKRKGTAAETLLFLDVWKKKIKKNARTGHSKRPRIKFLETDEGGKKVGSGAFAPCRRRNLKRKGTAAETLLFLDVWKKKIKKNARALAYMKKKL